MKNIIPFILVGGGVFYLLMKKKVANLNYYLKGFDLSFDGITPVLNLSLVVQNVNNTGFNVKSFVGLLYVGTARIGNVYGFTPVRIALSSETPVNIQVRLSPLAIVSDIVSRIVQKSGLSYELTLIGNLNAEGFVIPVNLNFAV